MRAGEAVEIACTECFPARGRGFGELPLAGRLGVSELRNSARCARSRNPRASGGPSTSRQNHRGGPRVGTSLLTVWSCRSCLAVGASRLPLGNDSAPVPGGHPVPRANGTDRNLSRRRRRCVCGHGPLAGRVEADASDHSVRSLRSGSREREHDVVRAVAGAQRGRVNRMASGPVWTSLTLFAVPVKKVERFGGQAPMGRMAPMRSRRRTCSSPATSSPATTPAGDRARRR